MCIGLLLFRSLVVCQVDLLLLLVALKCITSSLSVFVHACCFVQMVTVYSPLTWGIYDQPPPDIPECGFVGELCPPPIQGKLQPLLDDKQGLFVRFIFIQIGNARPGSSFRC